MVLLTGHFTIYFKSLSKQLGFVQNLITTNIQFHPCTSKTWRKHFAQHWFFHEKFSCLIKKRTFQKNESCPVVYTFHQSSVYTQHLLVGDFKQSDCQPNHTGRSLIPFVQIFPKQQIFQQSCRELEMLFWFSQSSSNEKGIETCKTQWLVLSTTSFCIFKFDTVLLGVTWSITVLRHYIFELRS